MNFKTIKSKWEKNKNKIFNLITYSKIIYVEPNDIVYRLKSDYKNYMKGGFINWGPWNSKVEKINDNKNTVYLTVYQLFVEGVKFDQTPQYKKMRNAVKEHLEGKCEKPQEIGAYWCRNYNDIDIYFDKLICCYNHIKQEGYKTQKELIREGAYSKNIDDEIKVFIDKSGSLILGGGGNHRIIICQLLGMKKIPVRLTGLHVSNLFRKKVFKLFSKNAHYNSQ